MREKLIELLGSVQVSGVKLKPSLFDDKGRVMGSCSNEEVADHLIANGVTILNEPESKTVKIKLPGRVKGHWHSRTLNKNGMHLYGVQCSVCSFFAFGNYEQYLHLEKFNFCPECGCAMRGEEE